MENYIEDWKQNKKHLTHSTSASTSFASECQCALIYFNHLKPRWFFPLLPCPLLLVRVRHYFIQFSTLHYARSTLLFVTFHHTPNTVLHCSSDCYQLSYFMLHIYMCVFYYFVLKLLPFPNLWFAPSIIRQSVLIFCSYPPYYCIDFSTINRSILEHDIPASFCGLSVCWIVPFFYISLLSLLKRTRKYALIFSSCLLYACMYAGFDLLTILLAGWFLLLWVLPLLSITYDISSRLVRLAMS